MSYSHKITDTYQTQLGVVGNVSATYVGDVEKNLDTSVLPSTTDEPVNIQWVAAKVQSMMFTATGACIIKTNSSSAPTTTLTLAANQLIMWGTASTGASPVPGDVTGGLFITNSGASAIAVKIRVLLSV